MYYFRASNYTTPKRRLAVNTRVMSLIKELNRDNVYIRDRAAVDKAIDAIITDGVKRLQVIADFDRTLSKHTHDGELCSTCHNILDESNLLPENFRREALKLRTKYYAIETDTNLSMEEKYPYMVEWWTKAHALLIECCVTSQSIQRMVKDSTARLRNGCSWLFQCLSNHQIPLLIFSAGLGDMIEEIIDQQACMYENMKIVSNYMRFNDQVVGQTLRLIDKLPDAFQWKSPLFHITSWAQYDEQFYVLWGYSLQFTFYCRGDSALLSHNDQNVLVGFQGDLIHTFNKNENAIHKSDYFQNIKKRQNVLLLGDSLGDLTMADGANAKHILKIGFLNDKVEQNLKQYKEAYDIVIVQDETMEVPNAITRKIIGS